MKDARPLTFSAHCKHPDTELLIRVPQRQSKLAQACYVQCGSDESKRKTKTVYAVAQVINRETNVFALRREQTWIDTNTGGCGLTGNKLVYFVDECR